LLALTAFVYRIYRILSSKLTRRGSERPHLRNKRKVVLDIILVVLLCLAITSGMWAHDRSVRNNQLLDAHQHFSVVIHGDVSEQRVNNTLIELEKQLSRLRSKYKPTNTYSIIKVELYTDYEQLKEETSGSEWAGAFVIFESGKPVIHLPAEQGGNFFTRLPATTTSGHELTHVVMHELVGPELMATIPLWFHEGLAEYESKRGFQNSGKRVLTRLSLWLCKSKVLDNDPIILHAPTSSETSIIFYSASYEFVDYIVSKHGGDTPQRILNDMVVQGKSFEDAFRDEVGSTLDETYQRWVSSFF